MTKREYKLEGSATGPVIIDASDLEELNPFIQAHQTSGDKLVDELMSADLPFDLQRLIIECGRMATRLDGYDRLLSGEIDLWLSISEVSGGTLEVRVDNVASEARQTAAVFRQSLSEVNRRLRELNEDTPDDSDPTEGL